jgi:3-oxoacyl-(acyl-carrier-protein) synthase
MSRIFVAGLGAVSPAGWNVAALREALDQGEPLPVQPLERPGGDKSLRARLVPAPATRPGFLAHPRLRRTSPITHYAAAAALDAVTGLRARQAEKIRLGLVVCQQAGCVNYSCRFFDEVLKDPATASPLLFPETVYAAPASHVAALLENVTLADTLVGDPASFLQGAALGIRWLEENAVDACLIIGVEETNWILADAHSYRASTSRTQAARAMRKQLPAGSTVELLCDGLSDSPRADSAERAAWGDWAGPRLSPKRVLGEGLMAAAAWQCVAACDLVSTGRFPAANISLVGSNQQAMGARFKQDERIS